MRARSSLWGWHAAGGTPSVVVDTTVGVVTPPIPQSAGVTLLMLRSTNGGTAPGGAKSLLIGIAAFVVAMTIFVWLQHRNVGTSLGRIMHRLTPEDWRPLLSEGASAIDDEVVAAGARRPALVRAGV